MLHKYQYLFQIWKLWIYIYDIFFCFFLDDERRKYSDEDSCKLDLEDTDFLIRERKTIKIKILKNGSMHF